MDSELAKQIGDPELRHLHVKAQIRSGVPLQLRAMRESRGWSQTYLAEKVGTTQNAISRLERPSDARPNIGTLERMAEVFDVGLLVRFVPFSRFVRTVDEMDNRSVAVPSFEMEQKEDAKNREQEAIANGILVVIPKGLGGNAPRATNRRQRTESPKLYKKPKHKKQPPVIAMKPPSPQGGNNQFKLRA